MNPIKPSIRDKKRYICFKVHGSFAPKLVQVDILSRIKRWIGEKNYALGKVNFMYALYDKETGMGIISCNVAQYMDVKMGIILTDLIEGKPAKVDAFYASGVINKCKTKLKALNGAKTDSLAVNDIKKDVVQAEHVVKRQKKTN